MQAQVLTQTAPVETRPLHLSEVERPTPAAGEIRVKVRACGVCHTDLHVVEGELPDPKLPLIPGHEVVGLVESLGSARRGFRSGIGSACPGCTTPIRPAATASTIRKICARRRCSPATPSTAAMPNT